MIKKIIVFVLFLVAAVAVKAQEAKVIEGTNISWKIVDGTLILTGSGEIPDYNTGEDELSPWIEYRDEIERIELDPRITKIGQCAFYFMNAITETPNPANSQLKTIESLAFANCGSLETVHLPASLEKIEIDAFEYSTNITEVYVYANTPLANFNLSNGSPGKIFGPNPTAISLYVPKEAEENYKNVQGTSGWSTYKNQVVPFEAEVEVEKSYEITLNMVFEKQNKIFKPENTWRAYLFRKVGNVFELVPEEEGGFPVPESSSTAYSVKATVVEGEYIIGASADLHLMAYLPESGNYTLDWKEAKVLRVTDGFTPPILSMILPAAKVEGSGEYKIEGKVFDENKEPIKNAFVYLTNPSSLKRTLARPYYEGAEATTETDEDGNFYFSNLPKGNYTLFVDFPGIEEVEAESVVFTEEEQKIKRLHFELVKSEGTSGKFEEVKEEEKVPETPENITDNPTDNPTDNLTEEPKPADKEDANAAVTSAELKDKLNVLFYPNPTQDILTIENLEPNTKISILNLQGKVVLLTKSTSNTHQISLQNLPAAQYLLMIETNQTKTTHKIVKE